MEKPNFVVEELENNSIAAYEEAEQAMKNWHQPMNSAHEGYGVLMEEVDELWDQHQDEKTMKDNRDLAAMNKRSNSSGSDGAAICD